MALETWPINLLSKKLSDYDIGQHWMDIPRLLEEYLITEGFHSLNEVPQGSQPIDNKQLDEDFVWLPWSEGGARIIVMLPLSDADSVVIPGLSRLIMTYSESPVNFPGIIDVIDNGISTFGNVLTGLSTAISDTIGAGVDAIQNTVESGIAGIVGSNTVANIAGNLLGGEAENIIEGVGNKIKGSFNKLANQLTSGIFGEIIGIAKPIGMDNTYEYYMFDFGPDIVPIGAILHYDSKKIRIQEPLKRFGNGIKERFIAAGGMGYVIGQGGGSGGGFGFGGFGGGSKGGNPINAPAEFLWKPISDSTGKLAVLVPAGGGPVTVNGERGSYGGNGNGGRDHYRFSKPGGAYGTNIPCVCGFGTVMIPDGALRYEGNGGHEVQEESGEGEGDGE